MWQAWFPLGPGEVYRPAYHVSAVYVRNINIVHVRDVTVIDRANVRYMNQNVAGAVTVVPHDAFIHARPVNASAVMVPRDEIMRARVIGSTAAVAPVRESVVVRGGMAVHAPPARYANRTVTVRNAPPPPPVSFAAKEQTLRGNGGRPLEAAQENSLRQAAPGPRAPMVRQVSPEGRTFGSRPAPAQSQPGIYQPSVQPQRPMRNDRPQTVRPQNAEQPQVRQPQPQVNQPAVRQNVERPAVQPQPTQPAPAAGRSESRSEPRSERQQNHKPAPKKNERTEKKDK